MDDKPTVFLSEFISEDTNPWDSRERFGIYSTFDGAAASLDWLTKDYSENNSAWAPTDNYGGSDHGKLVKNCWKWCKANADGDYEDDGDGYGLYVWEEYLDGTVSK